MMAHYNTSFTIDEEAVFNPNTLEQLCTQVCVANVKTLLFVEEGDGGRLTLRQNTPRIYLWGILDKCEHTMPDYIPMMLELCRNVEVENSKNPTNQPTIRLDLNNCRVLTDSHLRQMMSVRPVSLQIHNCPNLTFETLEIINEFGENLGLLHLGDSASRVLPRNLLHWAGRRAAAQNGDGRGILNTPKLRRLTIWNMVFDQFNFYNLDYFECLTQSFVGGMEALELRNCKGIVSLEFLLKGKDTLRGLSLQHSLHEIISRPNLTWAVLPNLTKLRFLDVSNCHLLGVTGILEELVRNLPLLSHLDLKGNLLGYQTVSQDGLGRFKINALASREQNPLNFINLHDTYASRCEAVPARVVVRDELFDKLMEAIQIYRYGEFSVGMLDTLEIISKRRMTDNIFLWKVAFDLLLKVAGANFNPYYSRVNDFVWKSLSKDPSHFYPALNRQRRQPAPKLDPSQLDQIFKLVIKGLSRSWENSKTLDKVMNVLCDLSGWMDFRKPPYVNVLVPALVRAGRTAIERCREGRESKDALGLLRNIGRKLCDALSESSEALRIVALEQGTLQLVREAIELDPGYLGDLYEEIHDKLVIG